MKKILRLLFVSVLFLSSASLLEAANDGITFIPIEHATMVIKTPEAVIYVDPVGPLESFSGLPGADIILVTDIHEDHFAPRVIKSLKTKDTVVVGPKAVIGPLGYGMLLNNGENQTFGAVNIEAIPMYNLTPGRLKFHEKGRGNGYVITAAGKRIYISGDTEDIREMRDLKNIDYAFVCMNLPYTMTVEQAASAVLEFKPKVVLPYHYKGQDSMSDIGRFRALVSKDESIEVRLFDWYKSIAEKAKSK